MSPSDREFFRPLMRVTMSTSRRESTMTRAVAFVSVLIFAVSLASAQATPPAGGAAATTRPAPAGANRSAEDQLRQMLQPQGNAARPLKPTQEAPPAVDVTSGPGAVAPGAATRPVAREGTLLLDRVGRLTRGDDGKNFEFVLDSDGRSMQDAPMVLIPNRKLMYLEDRVQGSYRDLKLRVTGEVMEYRGRNYLLLQRWSVVPDVAEPLR
jgi:hypothetical protein